MNRGSERWGREGEWHGVRRMPTIIRGGYGGWNRGGERKGKDGKGGE